MSWHAQHARSGREHGAAESRLWFALGTAALTHWTTASVMASQWPSVDLIVVDNASSDGTAAAIQLHHPDVHVVQNRDNLGYAEGNNVGIREALARHAAALVAPDVLEHLVAKAERRGRR
jgi:GT2 family glycosyltransferase